MKTILMFALIFQGANALAWVSTAPAKKEYTFKFDYDGKLFEVRRPASSYEEAFEKAADACFDHYRKESGGRLNEEDGMQVIDVCANPRS